MIEFDKDFLWIFNKIEQPAICLSLNHIIIALTSNAERLFVTPKEKMLRKPFETLFSNFGLVPVIPSHIPANNLSIAIIDDKVAANSPEAKKILKLNWKIKQIQLCNNVVGFIVYADINTSIEYLAHVYKMVTGQDAIPKNSIEDYTESIKDYLENIIAEMPGNIFWMDKNCIYLGCNNNSARFMGLSSRKDVVGLTYTEMEKINNWLPGTTAPWEAADRKVLASGKPINNIEEPPIVQPDGSIQYFLTTRAPIFDNSQNIIGVICVSIDISDRKKVEELQKHKEQAEKIREITAQVVHDINSPLTSLKVIVSHLKNIEEKTRITIRNAIERINDITNNLVIKYATSQDALINGSKSFSPELISCLVDNILSEKRAQYVDQNHITLDLKVDDDAQGLFARVSPERFKRILSNIINNSVEAINNAKQQKGVVNIKLFKKGKSVNIQIQDNGCGISELVLAKIGINKISTKGESGHGIGLSSAIKQLIDWGGKYNISSKINVGTTFALQLPIAEAPTWFQENLNIDSGVTIVILDDDQSIHDVWDVRFKDYIGKVTLKHFNNAEALISQNIKMKSFNVTYLIDYELLGSKDNGIEVIKKLNLTKNVCLVTSRYEDKKIRSACTDLNIRIIPKNFAPYIPITIVETSDQSNNTNRPIIQPDYILIDDDINLVDAWKSDADYKTVNLAAFTSIREFEKFKHQYRKDIPIYIDYQLGADDGLAYSKQLAVEGFSSIYIATGHDASFFTESMPWIKAVVGKEPPIKLQSEDKGD
jgi:signal transduction histidine kinase